MHCGTQDLPAWVVSQLCVCPQAVGHGLQASSQMLVKSVCMRGLFPAQSKHAQACRCNVCADFEEAVRTPKTLETAVAGESELHVTVPAAGVSEFGVLLCTSV